MNKLFVLLILTFNLNYLHASLDKSSGAAELYIQRAMENFELGNYKIAYENAIQVRSMGHATAEIHNILGKMSDYDYNDKSYARLHFDDAIELDPNFAEAYRNRSRMHFLKGNINKALEDINKALELDSKNAEAHNQLGVVNVELKALSTAIKNFTKAIKLDPKLAEAYYNLAELYSSSSFSDKEHEKAILNYTEAIKLDARLKTLNKRNSFLAQLFSDIRYPDASVAISSKSSEYLDAAKKLVELIEKDNECASSF